MKRNKRANNYAAAMSEPILNFPDSDTIGGASVLQDGTMTIQQTEPNFDSMILVKDPIISEVGIVSPANGGGLITGLIGAPIPIDTNMNPTPPPLPQTPTNNTTIAPTSTTKKGFPWILVIVAALVVVGVIYLRKK
jgi:hypothetical protein